jgi:hypothetical protein
MHPNILPFRTRNKKDVGKNFAPSKSGFGDELGLKGIITCHLTSLSVSALAEVAA